MKEFIKLFGAIMLLAGHAIHAENYLIEVCKIPLSHVFNVNNKALDILFHVWVRGTAKGATTAYSFEPSKKDPSVVIDILNRTTLDSNITHDDYKGSEASCKNIFSSNDDFEYVMKWSAIVNSYETARSYSYQPFGVGGMNCGMVAQKAVGDAGLEFPFENINGQDSTAKLCYDLGKGDAAKIATSVLNTASGLLENSGNPSAQRVSNLAKIVQSAAGDNEKCIVQ